MGLEQKAAERISGREVLVLLVLAAVHFANVMDFMIVMPLGPQYQKDLHITPQAFGCSSRSMGPVVTRAAEKKTQNRVIGLICPFLPP